MKRRWYEFREAWRIAWGAIAANRMRAMLATLGIVVGIVTVTLMGMAIEGINVAFRRGIAALGADTLYVQRRPWRVESYLEWLKLRNRRPLDLAQIRALEQKLVHVRAVAPTADTWTSVQYQQRSSRGVVVIGSTDQLLITAGLEVAQGRFITRGESDGGRPVCVIGAQVASNLFVREDPLGKKIRIRNSSFEVVGILTKRGTFAGQFNLDNQIMIPLAAFQENLYRPEDLSVQVKSTSIGDLALTEEEVRGALRSIRKVAPGADDDFAINQQQSIIESFNKVSGVIGGVGLFISSLSLFVGGVGIMNIMFVSVAERTREIGIRKAIGARRSAILIQFLIEAAGICLLGGMAGLGIAWAISLMIPESLPVEMSFRVAWIAVAVSVTVGLISGVVPAWRASRMNPVDALRQE